MNNKQGLMQNKKGEKMKRAKIIATLGPVTMNEQSISALLKQGVDVFRLNFSFGTFDEHKKTIALIRSLAQKHNKAVAILQDLQGPKIRVAKLQEPVILKKGMKIILSGNKTKKNYPTIPTTYNKIASDTKIGKNILLADGKIILTVTGTNEKSKEVSCEVINGGTVITGKGINLPYTDISMPALTSKDKKDAEFGLKAGVDFIGLSFVRHPEDIKKLKSLMRQLKIQVPVISKIEKPEALDNINEILDETDGIMVARGDLAVEISFSKVPIVQKELIKKANTKGKFTIVATEMLSSMIDNPRPTRAEASDVANAILDGTDAVMLSNETATGKFPLKAVKAMKNIIEETEDSMLNQNFHISLDMPEVHTMTQAICESASHLSYYINEKALAVITHSGNSVHILSKYRPQSQIIAATYNPKIYRRMALFHNVNPLLLTEKEKKQTPDSSLQLLITLLRSLKTIKKRDSLILLTGDIAPSGWKVNTIKIHTIN